MKHLGVVMLFLLYGCFSETTKQQKNSPMANFEKKTQARIEVQDSIGLEYVYLMQRDGGQVIGDVYVKRINDSVFTELLVLNLEKGKTDTLYQIKRTEFRNKKGLDFSVDRNGFGGYRFGLKKDNYFEITYLSNNGNKESDIITIVYNGDENEMEILKTP